MWIRLCFLTQDQFYVVNGAIYFIGKFLVMIFWKHTIMLCNKPTTISMSSYCSTYLMLKHRSYYFAMLLCAELYVLLFEAPGYIGTQWIKHVHSFYFVLFVPSRLGMCDRLNSFVCNPLFVPYNLLSLIYEKRTATVQKLKVHHIIQCDLWPCSLSVLNYPNIWRLL